MAAVESKGMRLLGRHDLGGHGNCGEGTALLEHGGRRYLYLAHEQGPANFSVLDVTDPREPELLTQTTLPHGDVRSNSLAIGDGLLVVAYQVARPGLKPAGIEIFDLSQPAQPRPVGFLDLSGPRSRGTHWVGYTGGRYAFLSTGTADSRPTSLLDDQFPVIVDLSPSLAGRPRPAGGGCPAPRNRTATPRRCGTRCSTRVSARTTSTPAPSARTGPTSATWTPARSSWTSPTSPRRGWCPGWTTTRRCRVHPHRPAPAGAEPAGDQRRDRARPRGRLPEAGLVRRRQPRGGPADHQQRAAAAGVRVRGPGRPVRRAQPARERALRVVLAQRGHRVRLVLQRRRACL